MSSDHAVAMGPGVRVIEDVLDAPGVETLEGRVGPLLFGAQGRVHYLDMPAGSYVDEHPHDDEAFTFAVRGSYVLCVEGERRIMRPGSLFWFGAGVPTGYEVPFEEDAYILIFRPVVEGDEETMFEGLEGMKRQIEQMAADGEPFMLADLPEDHPARVFAHEVSPHLF